MFLISKMIYDPTPRSRILLRGNRMGRTVGFVLHTPKFFHCHKYDFYTSQFDEMRNAPLDEETLERRYQSKRAHAHCTKWWRRYNRRHLSYPGYLYFVGPKRRYQLHYMGDINPHNSNPAWGYIRKHNMYVRWFDNGPQSQPQPKVSDDSRFNEILAERSKRMRDAMDSARKQCEEYERVRSGGV